MPSFLSVTGTMLLGSMLVIVMISLQETLPPAGTPSDGSRTNGLDLVPAPLVIFGLDVVLGGSGPASWSRAVLFLPLHRGMSARSSRRRRRRQHSHQKSIMLVNDEDALESSPSHIPSSSASEG